MTSNDTGYWENFEFMPFTRVFVYATVMISSVSFITFISTDFNKYEDVSTGIYLSIYENRFALQVENCSNIKIYAFADTVS